MKQKIMSSTILTNETGRSMVEMLGVLAIIGVLSVGGVYGYGVAMKKHKANELLHQASMLATTISAQIQSKGELPQSIEDFGNGKYGEFKEPEKANDEQFTMQITGMDSAVCEQMAKMAGGMVRKAECDGETLTLTYNNNLSSEPVPADNNGNQEKCEKAGNKYCEDSGSCVAEDKECPCPKLAQVKILNCDGTITDCCKTDGELCEQPADCSCLSDEDCYGDQVCLDNICSCPIPTGMMQYNSVFLGNDGKTCCSTAPSAWDGNKYHGVDYLACGGCPFCGDSCHLGSDGKSCCKGNYKIISIKETSTSATSVSEPSTVCGWSCPDGGKIGPDGETCCKDGLAYFGVVGAYSHGYYDADFLKCGSCPQGGTVGSDGRTCCKNGRPWDHSNGYYNYGYDNQPHNPDLCGCTGIGTDGKTCCADNYVLQSGQIWVDPKICGCPNGGTLIEGVCCKDGGTLVPNAFSPSSYYYRDYKVRNQVCGDCPQGGSLGKNNTVCCLNGLALDEETYYYGNVDVANCGCPMGWDDETSSQKRGELKNDVCCLNGLALDEWGGYSKTDSNCS